jgi:signal transduction histidine kinase
MKPSSFAPSWRSRAEGLGLLAVIALLVVLAVIQHRWLGAIAEAERLKLTEEATEKAVDIAEDVDRELTRAFLELRIDAKSLEAAAGAPEISAFGARVGRWRAESEHAGLVKAVYVAERTPDGASWLKRFDESARVFVNEPWPKELAPVQAAVEAQADSPFPLPIGMATDIPPVMADVPAILSPVIDVFINERAPQGRSLTKLTQVREMFMRHTGRGPVEILWLDRDYLQKRIVGAVAASRLGPEGPFEWSVVKSESGEAVAGSSIAQGRPAEVADAKSPMLRLRFDELDRSLLRGVLPGLSEVVSQSSVRLVVQMGKGTGAAAAGAVHLNRSSSNAGPWTLTLRHKEGSIDAAVRAQQRRNTALSASILGVLGVSAGLVFFSARRLRAIATQQVEFVAAVSHELRTPLAVIRSAADNLADGVVHEKDQAKRYGALIRDESVRLTDMVEHVLEFAGAESPGRASRGPVDVGEAAGAAVRAMESLAAERNASVAIDISREPLKVNGDMSHLTRAISNLIGNALKYGGDTPRVTVRAVRRDGGVEIAVADQGAGLSSSEIPRLFEPFYRGQRASETQTPGSGLGLALVKRIVESHGGRVSASNRPEGGALFTIQIPAV